jgi:predicted nucleotidyltransferase
MKRDDVLHRLSQHKEELRRQFGVTSLSLFGSVIRDEARENSDVDLLVEFDRPIGYFHLFRLQDYLENLLGGAKVDLVLRQAVINELQDTIYGEAVDVLA